ncbi:MFS transporter, DHA2 family, lincomycin resistance protein [Devosia lucknowensis]|uniref:MFS transporter, DHA2 family, lincomycin resistance protein n=1 Tax=Devosia lucknowensis TaxID=1096929 RepID=A0A1Y6EI79_9HYPH|nr:MDR family MFS transporter [Devosia lucknowensis]SMQ59863.1 MFS transporter, DHA2 family, lincomycin resistance protein [Devosia lucknowensis]
MTLDATMDAATPDVAAHHPDNAARNRLVIAILLVSTFVVFLNETIMSVAIPHLMTDLGVEASAAQWLTTGFLLTMAVVIPITGFLLQRLNTRPIFLLAISVFSFGTLICAVSPGLELLIGGRVIQAIGTAIMIPLLMTTVMTLVPPEARGKTMGNISIVMSVAPAIGPTIGGFILAHFDWRFMFYFTLPIALGALVLGATRIRNVSTPRYAPLDYLSVVLSALAFGGLVYGLSSFGESFAHTGEPSAIPLWAPIAVGVVAMGLFVWRQLGLQRENKALLDLRVFQSRNYTVSVSLMLIAMMALFGTVILLPIYTQRVVGLDTLQTGLLLLPGGLIMGLMGPFVGRLFDRVGPTMLAVPGTILVSAVLWALTLVGQDTSPWALLAGHVVLSIGLALIFTPVFTSSMGSVRMELYSHASAVLGSIQQLAGAAGIALFIALMTIRTAALTAEGVDPVEALASGIRAAFLVGAIISLFAIVAAVFIRKPEGGMPGHGGGH